MSEHWRQTLSASGWRAGLEFAATHGGACFQTHRFLTLTSTRFWRSVVVVLTGTAMAQAVPLLGSLVLARIYAPSQFGVFFAWLGVVATAAVVVTGRYEVALAIEADGEPRRAGLWAVFLCVALASVTTLAITLVVVAWSPAWLSGVPTSLIWAAAPVAATLALAQSWQSWAAANGAFAELGRMRIAQAVAITGMQIIAGQMWPTASSLGFAHGAGAAIGLLWAAQLMPPGRWPGAGAVRGYLERHRRLPMLSLPADTINTAASQLPSMLVAGRFGAEAAGLLSLALRTLGAPIALLGAAVLDVFKRRASSAWRERGECHPEYLQTMGVLVAGSILGVVALALSNEWLFAFAFGERWRAAGTIATWLLPMFALRFVASPLSYMMYVAGKQHVDLVWQVCLLGVALAALLMPAELNGALLTYSAGYSAMYVVYLYLSYRFSQGKSL